MVYDLHRIFLLVVQHLERTPSISLTGVSNNLRIERHTVAKAIRSATGVTFRELRNRALLKHACDLLNGESNRTVKEVAFTLGYCSQGSLSRFIRKHTGRSAKQFQNGTLLGNGRRYEARQQEM
jgi:AraC-like DNA-binding protein